MDWLFHYVSLIIPVLVLLPSFILVAKPPEGLPETRKDRKALMYAAFEGIGRASTFVLPLFYPVHMKHPSDITALAWMGVFLLFYYAGWLRYLQGNRELRLLYSPMLGIPVPLAVSPVLYFLGAAVLLHSQLYLLAALLFACGHIPASLHIYRQLQDK